MKKYLDFNGKQIPFARIDGQYWVAIKPICDALGVDYTAQFKATKRHQIFSQLLSKQTMVGADNRMREMVSLPERYVYGWIFQINSDSEVLQAYQLKCCDLLYEYFHGTLTRRQELLLEKAELLETSEKQRIALANDERYREIKENDNKVRRINTELKAQDIAIMSGQGSLFTAEIAKQ